MDFSDWITGMLGGSMVGAIPVALLAGAISFFSPCVLPLLPGYLSYASGLSATEMIAAKDQPRTGRMVLGTTLFVLGFSFVFLLTGVLAGSLGSALIAYQRPITIVVGILCIVVGLSFAGWLPFGQNEVRLVHARRAGLAAAPVLGIAFGLGWTPCIGPALSVVLSLAITEASAVRGGVLALFYSFGIGIWFIVAAMLWQRLAPSLGWVRKHQRGIQLFGAISIIVIGVLMVTGLWDVIIAALRVWAAGFGVPI